MDPVWLVYPTILPELVKRGTDDLGNATIRLVPAFYKLFLPTILLGAHPDPQCAEFRERFSKEQFWYQRNLRCY